MRDAESGLNGAPSLRRHVDRDKQIAREQRLCDEIDLPRMAPTLQVARHIDLVALSQQVLRGLCLAVHLGLDHIPARGSFGFGHDALSASAAARSRKPSSAGAST